MDSVSPYIPSAVPIEGVGRGSKGSLEISQRDVGAGIPDAKSGLAKVVTSRVGAGLAQATGRSSKTILLLGPVAAEASIVSNAT